MKQEVHLLQEEVQDAWVRHKPIVRKCLEKLDVSDMWLKFPRFASQLYYLLVR
jgi:hypothetical protein